MAELEELLDLSDAQAVAVQALHQEFFTKLDSARTSGGDRRAMRSTMRDLRDRTDAEVVELLSEEQAEKYAELRKQERERMRSRRPVTNESCPFSDTRLFDLSGIEALPMT